MLWDRWLCRALAAAVVVVASVVFGIAPASSAPYHAASEVNHHSAASTAGAAVVVAASTRAVAAGPARVVATSAQGCWPAAGSGRHAVVAGCSPLLQAVALVPQPLTETAG